MIHRKHADTNQALYRFVIGIILVVTVGVTWLFGNQSRHKRITPAPTGTIQTITPTRVEPNSHEPGRPQDYGDPNKWPFFNQRFSDRLRNFRFQSPSTFKILNQESARVYLIKDGTYYLEIDEDSHFASLSREQFANNYFYRYQYQRIEPKAPDLSNIERIDLTETNFIYKIPEDKNNRFFALGGQVFAWYVYLGIIDGHGVFIFDPQRLPQDVVLQIIKSIEFKD